MHGTAVRKILQTVPQNDSTGWFEDWKTRWEQRAGFGGTFIVE